MRVDWGVTCAAAGKRREGFGMKKSSIIEGAARRIAAGTVAGAMVLSLSPAVAFADVAPQDAPANEAAGDTATDEDSGSAAGEGSSASHQDGSAGDTTQGESADSGASGDVSDDDAAGDASDDASSDESAAHTLVACSFSMREYVIYSGKAKQPAITVKDGEKTLVAGTDYTVSYSNNKNPGVATATVTALGDYATGDADKDIKYLEFHIVKFQYRARTSSLKGYVNLGKTAGKSSSSTYLRSVAAKVVKGTGDSFDGGISYSVRTYKKGWKNAWGSNGKLAASSEAVQAIRFKLTGELAKRFDVYYRACARSTGWLDWAKNGKAAGVVGIKSKLRLVAYQLKVVPKGAAASGATKLSYATHDKYAQYAKYVLYKRIKDTKSRTKYMISVDTTLNRMAVYKGKKGHWKLLHYWICGTGKKSTPSRKGDFTLKGTTYRIDSGKISYYYFKRYKKGLGFHSVTCKIYTRTLSRPIARQLGHNISHGCIRLTMTNAKWVSNLPRHTHVCVRGLV